MRLHITFQNITGATNSQAETTKKYTEKKQEFLLILYIDRPKHDILEGIVWLAF